MNMDLGLELSFSKGVFRWETQIARRDFFKHLECPRNEIHSGQDIDWPRYAYLGVPPESDFEAMSLQK